MRGAPSEDGQGKKENPLWQTGALRLGQAHQERKLAVESGFTAE